MRSRVLFLVIAVLIGACGGSTSPTTADDSGDSGGDATTAAPTTTVADPEGTGDGENTGLPPQECVSIATALSQAASMGMLGQGGDPEDAASGLAAMAGAAPSEVADDFEVMAEAFADFAATLADAGVDFTNPASLSTPEAQAALAAAGEAFSSGEVEEASQNISAYMEEVCES